MYRSFLAGSATLALTATSALADERANVLSNYADIALAGYSDSLVTALALQDAINALVAAPSVETLDAARTAWIASRVPYQQTEVFRFGNPIVDDWEGKVNAWPLDEGLMDYVDASYGGPEPPPLNRSTAMFRKRRTMNGKQTTKSRRDSYKVTSS